MDQLLEEFIEYIIEVSSGKKLRHEESGFKEISIFKTGVTAVKSFKFQVSSFKFAMGKVSFAGLALADGHVKNWSLKFLKYHHSQLRVVSDDRISIFLILRVSV